jgi:hypothetical protein
VQKAGHGNFSDILHRQQKISADANNLVDDPPPLRAITLSQASSEPAKQIDQLKNHMNFYRVVLPTYARFTLGLVSKAPARPPHEAQQFRRGILAPCGETSD